MRVAILTLCGLLLAPAAGRAGGELPEAALDCVPAAVLAIQQRHRGLRNLTAKFEQTTRSVALGAAGGVSASRGEVAFAKPGKMRWSYTEPDPSLVVSDGHWLWIYDPEIGEAQRASMADGFMSGAAIQFLLGDGDLLGDFEVTAESCSGPTVALELVPRRPATYEKLRVVTDLTTGDLRETTVTDLLGNVTRIVFRDIRADAELPAGFFTFDPPPGVTVMDLEPASGRKGP